jgi:LacI family transcriptional regulator
MAEARKSTLWLVAERAGVSIASVSRVMNGQPASQRVTERVRAAAAELGYRRGAWVCARRDGPVAEGG